MVAASRFLALDESSQLASIAPYAKFLGVAAALLFGYAVRYVYLLLARQRSVTGGQRFVWEAGSDLYGLLLLCTLVGHNVAVALLSATGHTNPHTNRRTTRQRNRHPDTDWGIS